MATPVPYTGTTDVAPQMNALPQVHVDTPLAAFGGSVAGAVSTLGQTAQGVGKELFGRAYAMQEMTEQMAADKALADVMDKQVGLYLQFDQLKGKDRIDAFPKYQQDLAQIRDDGANELNSPYAKMQYIRNTRYSENKMLLYGGMLSKQGLDEYNHTASNALLNSISNQAAVLGQGEGPQFDSAVGAMKQAAENWAAQNGLHPGMPGYDDIIRGQISPRVAKIVSSIAREPGGASKAKELLDRYTKQGLISTGDALMHGPTIDAAVETHDAQYVAHRVAQGDPQYWSNGKYDGPVALSGLKASGVGTIGAVGPTLPDGSHTVGTYGPNSALLAKELPTLNITDERGVKVTTEEQFRNSALAQRQFAQQVFPQLQDQYKTFSAALKAWSGQDNPKQLNAALSAIARDSDPSVIADKARTAMEERAPNNPGAQDNAAQIATASQTTSRRVEDLSAMRDRNEVVSMINGTGTLDGRVPTSLGQALQDPKFADRYYRLPQDDQAAVIKQLQSNARYGGVIENSVGQRVYTELRSIAINRDTTSTPSDLQRFMSTNILQLPLSPQHMKDLVDLQHEVLKGSASNPYYRRAMALPGVRQVLTNAGIDSKSSQELYQRFTVAFHDALEAQGEGAGRPVTRDEDITNVAKSLVRTEAGHWYNLWSGSSTVNDDPMSLSAKNKRTGEALFRQVYGRDMVPDDQTDLDNANKLFLRSLYGTFGRQGDAAVKPKSTNRVSP